MNNVTEVAARKVIEGLVENEDLFTAHDVTTLLRAKSLRVRHMGNGGVRDFVHNLFNDNDIVFGDHNRSLERLPNGVEVFVFYPDGKDVSSYDPDQHRNGGTAQTTAQTPTVTVAPTVDDGKVAVDQRGRLCVRANLLRKLGVGPGDTVFVDVDMAIIVGPRSNRTGTYKSFVVDKDNCLRLSNTVLAIMFGYPTSDRYELTFETSYGSFIEIK